MSSASTNYAILDPTTDTLPTGQLPVNVANGIASLDSDSLVPASELPGGDFARYAAQAENNAGALITVTLPTYTNYLTLSTPVTLPAGDYLIGWHYICQHENITSDIVVKVHVTGATLADLNEPGFQAHARWEQKDSATTQTPERAGFRVVSLNAGINNILLDVSNSASQTNVRRGALYIIRFA